MWKYSLSHFYFLIFFKFISCCQCNANDTNQTDVFLEKRQLELEEFSTTELGDNTAEITDSNEAAPVTAQVRNSESNETNTEVEMTTTDLPETTAVTKECIEYKEVNRNDNVVETNTENDIGESIMEATEASVYISDTSPPPENETTTEVVRRRKMKPVKHFEKDLRKRCRHFKKGSTFDLRKMADVWQVVYYRLPNKLKCFKLHIKLVKFKEQQRYATVFGNFNDTVHWDRCFLEVKSSDKEPSARRHFLQGSQIDRGVMENIIIDEEHCQNATYLTLYQESGDQWLVIKNLLVMRDCETGDIVVFSRVPLQPRRDEIYEALTVFGETQPNGTMACTEHTAKSWMKYDVTQN